MMGYIGWGDYNDMVYDIESHTEELPVHKKQHGKKCTVAVFRLCYVRS